MQRREFLKTSALLAGSSVFRPSWIRPATSVSRPRPRPAQLAWQEAELGAVFHYDLHVFDGKRYVQGRNQRTPIPDPNLFAPPRLDTDQWIEAAAATGARFAILTASHETGFRLWQSDANPWCMKALRWRDGKGDVVRDFVESCRRRGILPGIYVGARWNAHLGVLSFQVNQGEGGAGQEEYNRLVEAEVEELCTRYGELFELWFDGGILAAENGGPDVLPIVERHQPQCLFYHSDQRRDARWGGTESGTVPYPCWATVDLEKIRTGMWSPEVRQHLTHGDPAGPDWCPAMSDAPLRGANGRHEWFWEPGDEGAVYPLDALVDMYERSVGHNSTLIVGLTPDPEGLMPDPDVARLREWGREIARRYGTPLATTSGEGTELALDLPEEAQVGAAILQEDIRDGERVREYVIEGETSPGERQRLAEGTCIGHKRIQPIPPFRGRRLHLRVNHSDGPPKIRAFAAYAA